MAGIGVTAPNGKKCTIGNKKSVITGEYKLDLLRVTCF